MTVRELVRLLRADGWERVGQGSAIEQWSHLWKPRRVTIAGRPREALGRAAAARLMRHVGLEATATVAPTAAVPTATRHERLTPPMERRDEVPHPDRTRGEPLVGLGP